MAGVVRIKSPNRLSWMSRMFICSGGISRDILGGGTSLSRPTNLETRLRLTGLEKLVPLLPLPPAVASLEPAEPLARRRRWDQSLLADLALLVKHILPTAFALH